MRWIKRGLQFVRDLLAPQPVLTVRHTPEQRAAIEDEIRRQRARADLAGRVTIDD